MPENSPAETDAGYAPHLSRIDGRAASANAESIDADAPFVTIASGLPRAGTSMMMQMLEAGGLPVLTDGARGADAANPRGYLEFEPVTRLREDKSWLPDAVGRCVKVVAPLLTQLPSNQRYRVIFMQRELDEVLASQAAMLDALERADVKHGAAASRVQPPADRLRGAFASQLRDVRRRIERRPEFQVLFVDYRATLGDPLASAEAVNQFLGEQLRVPAMLAAVDERLYRQRG